MKNKLIKELKSKNRTHKIIKNPNYKNIAFFGKF